MSAQGHNSAYGSLIGEVVNGHELTQLLGAGGMGEVYLAIHQTLGLRRAVKVIRDDLHRDDQSVRRFHREALTLSRLQHPNIVQIVDFGQLANGWPFLSMEFVEGEDLDQRVRSRGPLGLADALSVLAQLCSALQFAHERGVVHRDLKPANVILCREADTYIKVIDFGLAKVISGELMTRLTEAQQIVGSPLFMAPEQAEGVVEITAAADVYAVAGIAYVLLSGLPVFPENNVLALIYAHSQQQPESLAMRCKHRQVPALLDALMSASLAKDPAARPTADELAAHFSNLARQAAHDAGSHAARFAMDQTMAASDLAMPGLAHRGGMDEGKRGALRDSIDVPRAVGPVAAGEPAAGCAGAAPTARKGADSLQQGSGLYDLLFASNVAGDDALIEPLRVQILAVLSDLAEVQADDEQVAASHNDVTLLERAQAELDLDLAVLDSQIQEQPSAELSERRAHIEGERRGLAEEKAHRLRAMVDRIEARRPAAGAEAQMLYDELDGLVERLVAAIG